MIDACERGLEEPVVGIRTSRGAVGGLFPLEPTGLSFAAARAARDAFAASLDAGQRAAGVFPFDSPHWRRWCNIHRFLMRHGLLLDELDATPRARALDLVATALSATGLAESRGVMQINETIQEVSERFDEAGYPEFGEWMYWISLMGEASETEPWGWQLDGHHLNINCMMVGDHVVATPFFLGSEPLVAETGTYAGVRVLEREETLALELIGALDEAQRARAVVSASMPPGLFTGAFSDNVVLDYAGISFGELTTPQQGLLLALIAVYVGRLADDIAAVKMEEVRRHLSSTHFAWMGGTSASDVFYYRVHSPVILLEFDHEPGVVFEGAAPMKTHVHTMMRTPNGNDYGTDYLRQHRAHHH